MELKDFISKAIESGEIIKINYHGGSQPGTYREISPISVNDSKVKARCLTSNAVKTFLLAKIELTTDYSNSVEWNVERASLEDLKSLSDVYDKYKEPFVNLGWHVESLLNGDIQSITFHRLFKNGKPKKAADVGIRYEKYTYEIVYDWESNNNELEGGEQITGERKRPWSIFAKNETTRSYTSLDKATITLVNWVQKHSP